MVADKSIGEICIDMATGSSRLIENVQEACY
ncbi:hypothetical protein GGD38_006975 [Chitinophagaceae bacterium OAS944]|nr:hypothetical protein [Chitinophagaceae bacterium OAS944]